MTEMRRNPFSDTYNEWVVVSPNRMNRPWQGITEEISEEILPDYDPECPLCPGNERQNGSSNPKYEGAYVFPNDNPTFLPLAEDQEIAVDRTPVEELLFKSEKERGVCEVVVYTPDHSRAVVNMSTHEIEEIIRVWADRYRELGNLPFVNHVAEFETKGKELGNSLSHPHGQIWAQEHIPPHFLPEVIAHRDLSERTEKPIMVTYLEEELKKDERVVFTNDSFGLLVPFWANWPFETMLIPNTSVEAIDQLSDKQIVDLADALSHTIKMYSELFQRPQSGAPYMMGIHQSPTDGSDYSFFQMHVHFSTPLLTPSRQKHPAAYGEFFGIQRDITPEYSAQVLKDTMQKIK